MCKTGKKIKINFNKYIWFYRKMKKKKYFFRWFSSSWNEKKKWCVEEKIFSGFYSV